MQTFLAISYAPLLSGINLGECVNGTDPTCVTGVAHFDAIRRHAIPAAAEAAQDEPPWGSAADPSDNITNYRSLTLPILDLNSLFVVRHPLKYNINRLVLQDLLHYKLFSAPVIITLQDPNLFDVTPLLQTKKFVYLLSGANFSPLSPWFHYHEHIYFDEETHIALISTMNTNKPILDLDMVEIVKVLLDYIAMTNLVNPGCLSSSSQQAYSSLASPGLRLYDDFAQRHATRYNNDNNISATNPFCWVPMAILSGTRNGNRFVNIDNVLDQLLHHENPPAVIIVTGAFREDPTVQLYHDEPRFVQNQTWVYSSQSFRHRSRDVYTHYQMTIQDDSDRVELFRVHEQELSSLPEQYKDDLYHKHIREIHNLQQDILQNNPIVGYTMGIVQQPPTSGNDVRQCWSQECHSGNLLADAIRWKTDSDLAFLSSLFMEGVQDLLPGAIFENQVWQLINHPHTVCQGVVSGITLFNVFNSATSTGWHMFQVSGMRYTYNLNNNNASTSPSSLSLVTMEIWDNETQSYRPIQRLKLYNIATNSWLCRQRPPASTFLQDLTVPGEEPMKDLGLVQQQVAVDYLRAKSSAEEPLNLESDPKLPRIRNDPNAKTVLNLVEDPSSCGSGTTWKEAIQSCQNCPSTVGVQWNLQRVELEATANSVSMSSATILLLNGAPFPVTVIPKLLPKWVSNTSSAIEYSTLENGTVYSDVTMEDEVTLATGHRLLLDFSVSHSSLEPGLAIGAVSYGVLDGGDFPGCQGADASFDIYLRVFPQDDLNQLGNVRWTGWVLALVTVMGTIFCGSSVIWRRKHKLVRFMQPTFLVMICVGVAIFGLSMVTISFDDEIVSEETMDILCHVTPWLLSVGFSVSFSALFSKLWRINRLFEAASGHQRSKIEAKDVVLPFTLIFLLNLVVLVVWSVMDPLRWRRQTINSEEWNTYGECSSDGTAGRACLGVVIGINCTALLITCWQAYRARNLSDQFSESKQIGVALFSWLQLLLVSLPVLLVTSEDNVQSRYFLQVAVIFGVCFSMLVCLFTPILLRQDEGSQGKERNPSVFVSGIGVRQNNARDTTNDEYTPDSLRSFQAPPSTELKPAAEKNGDKVGAVLPQQRRIASVSDLTVESDERHFYKSRSSSRFSTNSGRLASVNESPPAKPLYDEWDADSKPEKDEEHPERQRWGSVREGPVTPLYDESNASFAPEKDEESPNDKLAVKQLYDESESGDSQRLHVVPENPSSAEPVHDESGPKFRPETQNW